MEPKRSSRRGALLWFAAALAVLATALWLRLRGNTAISGPGTPGRVFRSIRSFSRTDSTYAH